MNWLFALRAAILDRRVYEDITDDREWFRRAFSVVITAAISFGIGVRFVTPKDLDLEGAPSWVIAVGIENTQMFLAISTILMSWVLWSAVAYYVGTRLLGGQASYRIMIRSLGIAYSPGVLLIFMGFFPTLQFGIFNVVGLWLLAAGSIAIKEAQGFGWFKTIFPVLFGWFLAWPFLTFFVLSVNLPPPSPA